MIWFDWFCRQASSTLSTGEKFNDPRGSMAVYVVQGIAELQHRMLAGPDRLERAWYAALFPFVAPFLPFGVGVGLVDLEHIPHSLGLVLTRATANLLSDARPPIGGDHHWRKALRENTVIYVDVPHGAVLLATHPESRDVLQLRAMFVLPRPPHKQSHPTLFIALLTNPGSERPRGRICALVEPDGAVLPMKGARTSVTLVDQTLRAPFVDPLAELRIRERAADFLRLVLGTV